MLRIAHAASAAPDISVRMTALDLSSTLGLVAMGLLTVNILIGLLLSMHFNPVRNWPHRRVNTVQLHNWTGYAALVVSLTHPLLVLLVPDVRFTLTDLLYPLNAPRQPVVNAFGAVALYLLIVGVATSYFRFEIGRRLWKPVHLANYALFATYAVHGVLSDPTLKDAPIDPFDGEKVFVELCVLLVLLAIGYRVRWQIRQPPPRVHRPRLRRS